MRKYGRLVSDPTETALTVGDPVTGEALTLDAASDRLAEVALALKEREAQLKKWRWHIEDELIERLRAEDRKRATVGDWEIEIESSGYGRVWDADDLEAAARELLDAGVVGGAEVAGLLTPQPDKVDGKRALRLLDRVPAEARRALERCFEWQRKGRPRLSVTRSVQLLPPTESDR